VSPRNYARKEAQRQAQRQDQYLRRMSKHKYPTIPLCLLEEGFVKYWEKKDMTAPDAPLTVYSHALPRGHVQDAPHVDSLVRRMRGEEEKFPLVDCLMQMQRRGMDVVAEVRAAWGKEEAARSGSGAVESRE
jgi:hypothetical protein